MSAPAPAAAAAPVEFFPALSAFGFLRHGFTGRVPGIDVKSDREAALARLEEAHRAARARLGMGGMPFITAQQTHGNGVAVVDETTEPPVADVDGLVTNRPGVALGIYVADCGPVFLVDPRRRVIALLHSGKKGTESGIATAAVELMRERFGCDPRDMVAQLGPCIRPPHYEIDFAAEILRQCRASGVGQVCDCGLDTGADTERFYSYRMEQGKTGRLLALLALAPE